MYLHFSVFVVVHVVCGLTEVKFDKQNPTKRIGLFGSCFPGPLEKCHNPKSFFISWSTLSLLRHVHIVLPFYKMKKMKIGVSEPDFWPSNKSKEREWDL